MVRNDRRVGLSAVLEGALLGLEVDMDDAESLGVSLCPLEVVHERPGIVRLHGSTELNRLTDAVDVSV